MSNQLANIITKLRQVIDNADGGRVDEFVASADEAIAFNVKSYVQTYTGDRASTDPIIQEDLKHHGPQLKQIEELKTELSKTKLDTKSIMENLSKIQVATPAGTVKEKKKSQG